MPIVNMHEAKSQLSRLVEAVESGMESEVVIARDGKPAAKLVPVAPVDVASSFIGGGLKAFGPLPDFTLEQLDASNEEVANLFYGADE